MKNRPFISIGLAAILVLAMVPAFNIFAGAQEAEDRDRADRAATRTGPSIKDPSIKVDKVAEGLAAPTTMAFLDEDRILVLEKNNGTVRLVEDGELQPEPLLDVAVANENERGMLGIAASNVNGTTYVFLYFTESGGGRDGDDLQGVEPAGNRLYRYELQGDRLVNPQLLLDLPALPGPRYNGGPVAVGRDGNIYVIIGDVEGHTTQVQNFEDRGAADGTSGVLRIRINGEIPEPVIGTGVYGKYYFAYGIRNSFGLAFDPETGKLWDTENGPAFGDEINLVEPGFNSGWRDVQGVANKSDLGDLVLFNARSHYSDPEFSWTEPVGPTALAFLNSTELGEEYEGDMFVGDINNGAIYRFDLNENRSALVLEGALADRVADTPQESQEAVFGTGFGGITDIKVGPDGNLYVLSYSKGAIYQLTSSRAAEEEEEDDDDSETAKLTVRSEDLSGNTITGIHTVIKDNEGNVLEEGNTPLTFEEGKVGSTYTVIVSDFRDREFDHWEDGSDDRKMTVTLEDDDTTITARYEIESRDDDDDDDDDSNDRRNSTPIISRLTRLLNNDDCFDDQDRQRLYSAISNLVSKIFNGEERSTDRLQRLIDRLVDDCVGNDDDKDNGGNNGNGNRVHGRNSDDD
ncbi:MAG TPA: PQQ-dependent sugar dehydrogenase [Nitrososphaera sp.]|jgi:glucose/arabinose dehydrogenase